MKISRRLNNNTIIASDDQGRNVVLMGKGIGFKCQIGAEPNMNLVEEQFFGLSSGQHIQQLAELLDRIPLEHLRIGMQIVEHIQTKIQKPLNETLVLMVSDHVSFAIERHKKGLDLTNALLWEIKKFYPDEYQLGLDALDIIQREVGLRLRKDEAGFLAMHIANAQYGSDEPLAQDMICLIQDVVNLVRYTYNTDLNEDSLDYIRFITHLKFFFVRIFSKEGYQSDEKLYRIVSIMYPKATACTQKIAVYIRQKLDYSLGLEEQGYLIIHIEKLTRS